MRAIVIEGRRWLPGSQLLADAEGAVQMIRAGTARLVDDADLRPLIDATYGASQVRRPSVTTRDAGDL